MLVYQPFAVKVVLNSRQCASRAAKVFQYPGCNAAQKWNAFQHGNLMLVQTLLVFFAPARELVGMVTEERVTSKFTHDQRLIIIRYPIGSISVCRCVYIPADVLIVTQHIQIICDGIIDADHNAISTRDLLVLKRC